MTRRHKKPSARDAHPWGELFEWSDRLPAYQGPLALKQTLASACTSSSPEPINWTLGSGGSVMPTPRLPKPSAAA